MKKFIINIITITGLAITLTHIGCSAHRNTKQIHNYSNERYHKASEDNRGLRYEHPRYN